MVRPERFELPTLWFEASHTVYDGGEEVNLQFRDTNLEHYCVWTDRLIFVERMAPARTSNPFTTAEPLVDSEEILEHIALVHGNDVLRILVTLFLSGARTSDIPRGRSTAGPGRLGPIYFQGHFAHWQGWSTVVSKPCIVSD